MTDDAKTPPPADHPGDPIPRGTSRNIPPLVWVILALLVAVTAWAAIGYDKTNVTPQGEPVPAVENAEGVATGKAP
ncbi:hypothetical protein [Phenylobacterium ferrooxidans]|uniref:Uncharacterized protein n=1 Tax=Phenylobacterium ferrooxidans TaxID=2982689 RepID=A0ABW6CUD5_9CAUL